MSALLLSRCVNAKVICVVRLRRMHMSRVRRIDQQQQSSSAPIQKPIVRGRSNRWHQNAPAAPHAPNSMARACLSLSPVVVWSYSIGRTSKMGGSGSLNPCPSMMMLAHTAAAQTGCTSEVGWSHTKTHKHAEEIYASSHLRLVYFSVTGWHGFGPIAMQHEVKPGPFGRR